MGQYSTCLNALIYSSDVGSICWELSLSSSITNLTYGASIDSELWLVQKYSFSDLLTRICLIKTSKVRRSHGFTDYMSIYGVSGFVFVITSAYNWRNGLSKPDLRPLNFVAFRNLIKVRVMNLIFLLFAFTKAIDLDTDIESSLPRSVRFSTTKVRFRRSEEKS